MGGRGAGATDRRLGQSTVETALLVPTVLVLVALLAQPACLLYTRAVMASAAHETTRLVATSPDSERAARAFALRRLEAVPDAAAFHEGGPEDWEVRVEGPGEGGRVTVEIEGRVRPLPLLGAVVSVLGPQEGGLVVMRVEAAQDARARWIGGSYEEWIGIWG